MACTRFTWIIVTPLQNCSSCYERSTKSWHAELFGLIARAGMVRL
jgi:hypothetical protein